MARVSKKKVIIKDHMTYSIFSQCLISFTDFISDVGFGVKCAFNFPKQHEWESMFKKTKLKLIKQPKKLNFGFYMNERYNPIFVLEK